MRFADFSECYHSIQLVGVWEDEAADGFIAGTIVGSGDRRGGDTLVVYTKKRSSFFLLGGPRRLAGWCRGGLWSTKDASGRRW